MKKSRAARAKSNTTTMLTNHKIEIRPLATTKKLKCEDPAKMTYSIPDFVSRNATNHQEFFQYLEKKSPITKINTYRGADQEFYRPLPRPVVPFSCKRAGCV